MCRLCWTTTSSATLGNWPPAPSRACWPTSTEISRKRPSEDSDKSAHTYIHTYICIHTFIIHSLVSQMLIHEYIHQWLSDDDCPSLAKILLLRVDQIDQDVSMAAQRLEEVTYNVFGINDGYEGGDKHRFESSCWVLRYFPS